MIKSIQTVLSPLLIISYISGLSIIEFPINSPHPWFGILYVLIFWSVYYFLLSTTVLLHFVNKPHYIEYYICLGLDLFTILVSVVFGIYHDKKFKNCLKKLNIVDDTFLKLGTTSNYQKLRTRTIRLVSGWCIVVILANCGATIGITTEYDIDIATAIYIIFMRNYCSHINAISDLTIASILGYIKLKFEQINEHVWNFANNNKHEIKQTCKNPVLHSHQCRLSKISSDKYIMWIIIHLHLELCKISREVDSIFGVQMTFKMGCYFAWLALDIREIFSIILINNYTKRNKILYTFVILSWFSHNVLKLFFINYICEIVSTKANTTGSLINRISYFIYDAEVRENVSQLLLQMTHAPLKFCGMGFFQFGYKFLHGFCTSVATVLVLLIQAHINK
ncbi:putative gustatory receptor 28a isoform X2 [Linepithema humile]|uniref:putative gustatory receptor 28a isoform X2 n=1 Tax=Linepithema humile TaxID=83485 RepID=UPI000623A5C2|nr:PREDICTED: uncharacterized protein LOC105676288 [Linepithema humile]